VGAISRYAPCTAFADFAKVPSTPQHDQNWLSRAELIASSRADCDVCTLSRHYAAAWISEEEYSNKPVRLCRHYDDDKTSVGPVPFFLHLPSSSPWDIRLRTRRIWHLCCKHRKMRSHKLNNFSQSVFHLIAKCSMVDDGCP
jgi:hypothetical protein